MANDVERARDEQLIAAFSVVLTHFTKFEISLNGELWIERLPSGQFRILHMRTTNQRLEGAEEIFDADDIRPAVSYFLDVSEGRAEMIPLAKS